MEKTGNPEGDYFKPLRWIKSWLYKTVHEREFTHGPRNCRYAGSPLQGPSRGTSGQVRSKKKEVILPGSALPAGGCVSLSGYGGISPHHDTVACFFTGDHKRERSRGRLHTLSRSRSGSPRIVIVTQEGFSRAGNKEDRAFTMSPAWRAGHPPERLSSIQ